MGNAGYSNRDRFDDDCHGVGARQANSATAHNLTRPTSTGEQHTRDGYMLSEAPTSSDGEQLAVSEKYATGVPNGANIAAQGPPG